MIPLKTQRNLDENTVCVIFHMIPEILTHHCIFLNFLDSVWENWDSKNSTVGNIIISCVSLLHCLLLYYPLFYSSVFTLILWLPWLKLHTIISEYLNIPLLKISLLSFLLFVLNIIVANWLHVDHQFSGSQSSTGTSFDLDKITSTRNISWLTRRL